MYLQRQALMYEFQRNLSKLNLHSIHEQPRTQFGQTYLKVQNDLVDSHDATFFFLGLFGSE